MVYNVFQHGSQQNTAIYHTSDVVHFYFISVWIFLHGYNTRQLKQRNPKHRAGAVSLRLTFRGRTEPATDRKFQASFSMRCVDSDTCSFSTFFVEPGFYKSRHKCLFASSLWQTAGMVSVRTQNLAWPHPPILGKGNFSPVLNDFWDSNISVAASFVVSVSVVHLIRYPETTSATASDNESSFVVSKTSIFVFFRSHITWRVLWLIFLCHWNI